MNRAIARWMIVAALAVGGAWAQLVTPSCPALPEVVGTVASGLTCTASGGVPPYTFSLTVGALPPGLTMDSLGNITGQLVDPAGPYDFTVQATDSTGLLSGFQEYSGTTVDPLTLSCSMSAGPVEALIPYSDSCTAAGGTPPYAWSLGGISIPPGLAAGFNFSGNSATIGYTPVSAVASYQYNVSVTDSSPTQLTKAALYSGAIAPVPGITTTSPLPAGAVGAAYSQQLSASGGVAPYTWSANGLLGTGLSINPSSGLLSGTPVSTAAGTVNFSVTVIDSVGGTSGPVPFTVSILGIITASPLPAAAVGSAYSQQLVATGGAGGYTWAVTAGALPAGLALSSAGLLNAATVPATAITATFSVTVTDSTGTNSTSAQFTLPVTLAITTTSLPAANIGTAYSQTLTAVGGAGGYTWAVTSGSLPVAITLNAATGALSGTPQSSAQNATFTVTATDKNSATVSAQLTLAVKLAITTSSPLANGALNAQYNQTLTGEGGLAPYSWSVTSGSLPAGLTLSAAGAITGAPSAAGTFTFTVQLADSATPADTPVTKQFVITIGNGLTITTAQTLPNATVGVSYTQPLAATGGAPPYGWALTTGSAPLPAPLTLNANGTITGTPTAPSVTTFSVTVTDSASTTASQQFTLTVVSPPLITTNSLPDGTVGVSYSQTLAATAGTSPYSWALSGGSLPTGLTLSSAGAISGKPSVPGMASFSVKLTDATGVTATRALSITIASSLSITSPAALPGAIFNVVYSDLLQATGGTMPYTWKVTGGSLPAALSLQANGTIAGLPTAVGSFSFTAQVTDSVNAKASAQFSLTVSSGLTITTSTLPGSAVGAAYSQTLAAGGGTAPYTWSIAVGALPGGLTLTSTGSITGTAAAAGTFTFTVQVKDNTGATAAKQLSIAVTSGLTITTPAALPAAPLNGAYSKLLAATGGAPPYTWAVSGGALPTGLTLGATTGAISGTATVSGPFSFTVTVTDSASATASQQFTLTVIGQLSVTPPLLKGAVRGTYNQPLAATGGAPPYTFAITSGTLPPGITLAGSTLGGKFVSVGDFTFTIQVTDSANATASQSFTIVVSVLTINPAVLPGAVVGTAYTTALTANNGTPPYAWSVTQGALPAGLTLDPAAGTISGTPTAASTANFMIQVVDSTNASGVQPYSLTVAGAITASYTGISGTAGSDEQLSGALTLGAPSTEAITGTLTLSFQPDASLSSPAVDPSIQFATSGTTVPIDIRASTTAQQFSLQTGTVAGTITLTVTSWQVSGVSVTPPAALTQSIQIAKAVPVISAVTATATPSGFQVVITGYSNTREVSQANLQFTAAAGQNLTTTSLTVPLTSAAATWFSGSASDQFGSQFILTLPFTVSNGAASAISSVSVQLVNSQGTSTSASATL